MGEKRAIAPALKQSPYENPPGIITASTFLNWVLYAIKFLHHLF